MREHPLLNHWDEIDALFDAALDQPERARAEFVRRAAASRPQVAAVVTALLADREAGAFLEQDCRIACDLVEDERDAQGEEEAAAVAAGAGPYRLVEVIGRGGTGTVYRAERRDGSYEQRVAVKLLRRGLDTEDILARFRAERQILASLSHPNIARLLDGGATNDQRPYLVVELIEGAPITRYCDERRLDIDARLRLFLDVCRAVQYAHDHLVLHRDLKPGNILITNDGQVKLLDFGLARILEDPLVPGAAPVTRTGLRMMTPEYASPEQLKGSAIGIASDVYQLGILLYEMLTGDRPWGRSRPSPLHALRTGPVAPSAALSGASGTAAGEQALRRRTDSRRLRARLRGDLDTIVLMALRESPERRYPNVAALLADIERHLDGRPVLARPDTVGYRARKFVRRHPSPVAAAVTLAFMIGGYTQTLRSHGARLERERYAAQVERAEAERARASAAAEGRRAEEERDRADDERRHAEEARIAADRERLRAESERRRALGARREAESERDRSEQVSKFMIDLFTMSAPTAARTNEISARELLDQGSERALAGLGDQPEVRARLLSALAGIYGSLGASDRAGMLREEALRTIRSAQAPDHPDVIHSLRSLALHYRVNRDFARAEPLLREALTLQHARREVSVVALTATMAELALVLRDLGQVDTAERLLREALAITRARMGTSAAPPDLVRPLAYVLRAKGDLDGAESLYRELLAHLRSTGRVSRDLSATLNNLASLLVQRKDAAAAEPLYRESLAIESAELGEAHRTVAIATGNLVGALVDLGKYEEVESLLRTRIDVERRHNPATHWRIGSAVGTLAAFFVERGNHQAAEPLLREQVGIYTAGLGDDHGWTASARSKQARTLVAQRRFAEAETLLHAALAAIPESAVDEQRVEGRADVRAALVALYEASNRPAEARQYRRPQP